MGDFETLGGSRLTMFSVVYAKHAYIFFTNGRLGTLCGRRLTRKMSIVYVALDMRIFFLFN